MKSLLALVFMIFSGSAFATTIDFQEFPYGYDDDKTVITQGYEFSSSATLLFSSPYGSGSPDIMLGYCPGCTATMSNASGYGFSLDSLDITRATSGGTESVTITGFYAGGGSVSVDLPVIAGLVTHNFDSSWSSLVSVEFGASDSLHTFDFLFVDNIAVTTVPVPAAFWLFVSALGLLGFRKQ